VIGTLQVGDVPEPELDIRQEFRDHRASDL